MASGGSLEDEGAIPLDIDNVHMLLQVEHEQIQKRTFTNWINAQLAKRCPPSYVSDLFSDLRDGSQLLDLLEVMSGQPMKRQRGHGLFQQRTNIETALNFLKKKSIKLVNINIPDIIDGRPSIILGLVWSIILHCHIEELACNLSFSSCHSSIESLASLDSWSGSPVPVSPVHPVRTSPLHRHFSISAKKALLLWVTDQCQRVGSSFSVKDFKSSWRSGEAFLVILCSLRPQLVDLSLVQTRSNQENLELAFDLAERELHIPRLLEVEDVDVEDPDEKSIMTYVAQFLQYSNDMPAPDDHLQVSPSERAQEMTCWLQEAYQELSEAWTAAKKSNYAEKYQVFQGLASSFSERKRPVMTHLATMRRCPELSQEQHALRTAWDHLEEKLQRCKTDLDLSLPPPLDTVILWLQHAEAVLTEEGGRVKDHADVVKEARALQDTLKTIIKEMSQYDKILDAYNNVDDSGNVVVSPEKLDEIKKRLTYIRVTARYQGIMFEYRESRHAVLDLLGRISSDVQTWKSPYSSKEAVHVLLQDWHEKLKHQGLLLILMDALQNLKEKANVCISEAALVGDSQLVTHQVKEAESEAELVIQTAMAVRGTMERTVSAWDTYNVCLTSLQTWLEQTAQTLIQTPAMATQDISEWASCQAKLNEMGNFLIEVTETSTSRYLAKQLSKVNMQWAECMKKEKFEVSSKPTTNPPCLEMVHSLIQEASWLLRQPLEVAPVSLKSNRQKLQLLSKKLAEVDLSSLRPSPDFQTNHIENLQQTLPQMLAEAERTCCELQRAVSKLESCLAELDHWSTDALDYYQDLKVKEHRGHATLEPTVKVLISRGLQLENQAITAGQDLQDLVAQVQKTFPLQNLSLSDMQEKIFESVSYCQEILGMLSPLGFGQHVSELVHQTQTQPERGSFFVARSNYVDQIENTELQTCDPSQSSPEIPVHTIQQRTRGPKACQHMHTQNETSMVIPRVKVQMLPQPSREPPPLTHSVLTRPPVAPLSQKSPVMLKNVPSADAEENEGSSPSQTRIVESRIRKQPNTESNKISPQPQILLHSEVHLKAQSMVRSRLENAGFRLQECIQQSIMLFGGREISESQAKKKQKALKILQPVLIDEFLDAVEGFEAFCSGPQLQGLTHLSDSVKKQWEDVRREMAAFVPILWSKLREGRSPVLYEMHTNTLHKATEQTDSLQHQQAATEGAASLEEHGESFQKLSGTLTSKKSSWLSTDQLKESNEAQEAQPSGTVPQVDSRGQKLGGNTPLRETGVSASTQRGNNHLLKQSVDHSQKDLSPVAGTVPCLLQQSQSHIQAIVPGVTGETKQEAGWTIISEDVAPTYIEYSSEQKGLENYRQTCLILQAQLQKNKQHLGKFISDPPTISTLQKQKKQLEALKQETEILWFGFELQYALLSQSAFLMTREDLSDVEWDWEKLTQEWRGQQMCLQSRMASLESSADLIKSADDLMALIEQKLDGIVQESVKIFSFTLVDPRLVSDLKEMDAKLQSEIKKLSDQSSEEETQQLESPCSSSLHRALHNSVRRLKQARQQLEKVHSAARALDHFLATLREIKAEVPTLLADQDPSRQQNKADWEQERHSWQATMQQRLQTAAQQSDSVDCILKAVGMTLTMGGATVTCQDVVKSLSKHVVDVEETPVGPREQEREDEINPVGKEQMYKIKKNRDDSPEWEGTLAQEHHSPKMAEEESQLEAKRSRLDRESYTKTQEEEHIAQSWRSKEDVDNQRRRRSTLVKGDEERVVQRRVALLGEVREIRGAAEQLGLQEPTLPALQQRSRVLKELQCRLAGLFAELQHIEDASSSGIPDVSQTGEVENLWEETTKTVTERLEQCTFLTELLKRFQSIRGDLSGTLQRAESTISEQASYMGKDNLQRLHSKVQETKAELNGLGERIEEVRCVCRQLCTHLHKIPECTIIPFENEADALMDHWLDISERTDSHLDNLHVSLTLWDVVLQLGAEVQSWTANKLAVFAESPSFQTENDIKTLQNDIAAQEGSIKHFHQRAAEIQSLLQSTELPLELQVVETQIRKKMEQLKELVSEAEDVYRQMVTAKEQITSRMAKCFDSLQMIEDSILTLSGSDVATVLAKLKELCWQLQSQDKQAESLLEDLHGMASIASPESLQSLSVDGVQLQEEFRNIHQLFSEVEERTVKNIQDLDRLQRESEYLEQWLQTAEKKSAEEDDVSFLQEEEFKQRVRTELLCQLVSSLEESTLQQSAPLEKTRKLLERYYNFKTNVLDGTNERQSSLSQDIEAFKVMSKRPQCWIRDLRQLVDSPVSESLGIQCPVEQKQNHAQAVVSATAEGETCLEELRAAGNSLSQRLCDEDDLKQEVLETIQTTEENWRQLLQSVEPYCSVLKADPEFTSSHLAEQQEAGCRLEDLKTQTAQLPTLLPWPGTAELRKAYIPACQPQDETESPQVTLISLAEQRRQLAEQTSDTMWKDSSWAELDRCLSGLMEDLKGVCSCLKEGVSNEENFGQLLQGCYHKLTSLQHSVSACQAQKESSTELLTDLPSLEALLQEMPDMEKHLLELVAIKDSISASATAEAQASFFQQVSNMENHKRAVEGVIRAKLNHERLQQVKFEVSCVQTALQDLNEIIRKLFGNHKDLPDIKQLKQQWYTIQLSDNRLTELAAGLYNLQKTEGSSITQEKLPTDVIGTVEAVTKDIESFRSFFLQKKQQCAENTSNLMRQVINQLQQWIQTVQTERSSPSQAVLDEGLWLQQSVHEVLSEIEFLQISVCTEVSKELENCALDTLDQSTLALKALSKHLVSQGVTEVELEEKGLTCVENFRSDDGPQYSASPDKTMAMCGPASLLSFVTDNKENTESDQNDNKTISKGTLFPLIQGHHPPTEPGIKTSSVTKPDDINPFTEHLAAQPETFKIINNSQVKESHCEQISLTPKKVFTIVLDMKPQQLQSNDVGADVGPGCSHQAGMYDAKLTEVSSNQLLSTLLNSKSDKTNLKKLNSAAQSDMCKADTDVEEEELENTSVHQRKIFTIMLDMELQQKEHIKTSTLDLPRCSEGAQLHDEEFTHSCAELICNEVFNSSTSRDTVAKCQLTGTHAEEATLQGVKQEGVKDSCDPKEQSTSSVLCTVGDSVQTGNALAETQKPVGDNKQIVGADTAQSTIKRHAEMIENANEPPEFSKSGLLEVPKKRATESLLKDKSESKLQSSVVDTRVSHGQVEIQESMDPTALGMAADLGAAEMTDGSPESYQHRSTMQDILSKIQSVVEKITIINRRPHIDLKWYLQSCPGEADIRLVQTVQQVLACRYQPAQLGITAMVKQLEQAEEYRRYVEEQVATMKSWSATMVCDPILKRAEEEWSAALLDASATVQVKAAQLEEVRQYHKHMKMARAFLEVLAAEKEKMSLKALESSAVQADKLHALMQTMKQKKSLVEELLQLSSKLSVHVSGAEGSGAPLAWLGGVQEEWRLLEGSIRRALQHATNSTSQFFLLMKEAEQLKTKLEALQISKFESCDCKSDLELVCVSTDLTLYNQLYLHLQSQSNVLFHFCLGQREQNELQLKLQELGSLLNLTKGKLDISRSVYSVNINKQLRDLIIWVKQAETHISVGKKLALFPEEARIQISEMTKFQTDILSRRCKIEEMKNIASDLEKDKNDLVLKTIEDLYEAITDSLDHTHDTMKKNLEEREKLLSHLTSMDAWLAETHATRDPCAHVENVSIADNQTLESELQSHKLATAAIESQLNLVEAMAESCKDIAVGLSPGESHYLVNRVSGLWTQLDVLLAHEKANSWELEELIHERTTSEEEFETIQASLKLIASDLEQQKFPIIEETLSRLKHRVIEHQCQVQEHQHCQHAKQSSLLNTIGELKDKCRTLSLNALEQDKYLNLRRQMEESRDIAKELIKRAKDKTLSVDERFTLSQALLVKLPLVQRQCQEASDQLEAIAQELYPSELNSERQRIHRTVEAVVSFEHSVTVDIKNLEAQLLLSMRFSSELPALIELFQRTRMELEGAKPVSPDEKAIESALQRYRVIWRNMESWMRVLESLGQKESINLKNYTDLYSLKDETMQECHLQMERLSQARESLRAYHCAAQKAVGFLHNSQAMFISASGGFLDCTEEQRQIQQVLEVLEDGFQAHICHLVKLVTKQTCFSHPKTEQLHISILSQLLVGRAVLKAQAQHRMESSQRCSVSLQSNRSYHEEIQQHLSEFETRLSECAMAQVTSYDKCIAQQKKVMLLKMDLQRFAGKIEELRSGCVNKGCVAGKGGELRAHWRRWLSLQRHVGFLMAHTEQKEEEWKDITMSMEQCCSLLASLQAEVLDSSSLTFTHEEPHQLLAQAEKHHASLEQEQQALASLEHRLALSFSTFQHPNNPGPVGKTLVKIKENFKSLRERKILVVAAAQAEEKKRQQIQENIEEVEKRMLSILPTLQVCSDPSKQQEFKKDLSSQKAKLKSIMDGVQSRYDVIPAYLSRRLNEVQLFLQRAEEKLIESSSVFQKITGKMAELASGLGKIKVLLEQQSPTVSEAQNLLKHVWDELDAWHSHLMLLENEVQDLAEEHPDQAHLLIDRLTHPLQLYQNTAQMAEQRTSFLSKIPACLQEFEDILYSASCWLDDAKMWLSTHCAFTTARSLQNHANSLQLVLDDSERIRNTLRDFRLVLAEISSVCDISTEEERLKQNDHEVHRMQCTILEPLEQLLQAVEVVDSVEADLKTMEKSFLKIRAILSSMENSNITLTEHLQNRQVILDNVKSMQKTLEEIDRCKGDLYLPQGAKENLIVFSQARGLMQQLEELEQLTQHQVSHLENRNKDEEGTRDIFEDITVFKQEAFEVSNSEEEENEDDESSDSSSSDTLTCSIPEDPGKTLNSSDVQSEDINLLSDLKELKSFTHHVETRSEVVETLSVKSGFDTSHFGSEHGEIALRTMDTKADDGEAFCDDTATESVSIAAALRSEEDFTAAYTLEQHKSPNHEKVVFGPQIKTLQTAAVVEDTRLIPVRPITPFITTEFITREDEDLCLSTTPQKSLLTSALKEQLEVSTSLRNFNDIQASAESKIPSSLVGHEDDEGHPSWSKLYAQISQNLATLKKMLEDQQTCSSSDDGGTHEKVLERSSASAVLQGTHESITMLRQMVTTASSTHPGVKENLYAAVQRVILCLDSLTVFLLTPGGSGEDDGQLRLLQQECLSTDIDTLAELLKKMESETRPVLLGEEQDVLHCLNCLQDCLHTVQLVFTMANNQLHEHLSLKKHKELPSKQLCTLDEFDLGQSEIFPILKIVPTLECVLGRHLTECPGEKTKLQQASQSLLQGITRLLELGEECKTEAQMNQVHNRSQLQDILCGRKKLLQVLKSQLAFVQHLFQCESDALKCQEEEWVHLQIRAKALQQQALEKEVAFQTSLQELTRWEDNCGRLGRVLVEFEAFISSEELEGDDEAFVIQHRADACQQALIQLYDSRATLGLLLDQRDVLQKEPMFATSVCQAGGALELQWRSVYRRTEQEIQRCRAIQDSWTRYQTDLALVSEWLDGANKHLKTLSDLADTTDLDQECIQSHLIKLLDFSMEVEAMSVHRTSVSKEGTKLIHLREAECPKLRAQLAQLDISWNQLTSDLSKAQDQLQQQLLAVWPPLGVLSDLEDWLRKLETRLNKEKETVHMVKNAAHITEVLQNYKELKAGLLTGQFLLDFLCQSGPQVLGADVQAFQSKSTIYAEKLGALRLQWLYVQRELENQICEAEQIHQTCAGRERRLKHHQGWIVQQKEQLNTWRNILSPTLIHKALLEWEDIVGRIKDVAAALQELKAIQVNVDKEEAHPCDIAFCNKADTIIRACWDLWQQMKALRPALQQTAMEWSCYNRDVREAMLHSTWVSCALQHHRTPLFSLKQTELNMHRLQQLEDKAGRGEALWAAVEKSYQSLVKSLHCETPQALCDQMEGERKRWKDVVQELKDEHLKTAETLSLWQVYSHLSENCSLHLQQLWHQWQEMSSSSLSPEQDAQAMLHLIKKLQDATEDLQRRVGDVLAASKPLTGRLQPQAANVIKSEIRFMSCDVQLLCQAVTGKRKSFEEILEDGKLFDTRLEALDERMQRILYKLEASSRDTDSVKQVVLELSGLFPLLVDVRDMSGYVTLNNQDTERLQRLSREWIRSMTCTLEMNRELQAEHQHSQTFHKKCKNLMSIQDKLKQEFASRKLQSYSTLQELLIAHQGLQAELIMGHQLLQGLLCDAVTSIDEATPEKRSELMAQVSCVKESWLNSVALANQGKTVVKEQLRLWRTYQHGLKLLWKLLRDVDPLLALTCSAPCAPSKLRSCGDDYKCFEEALGLHSTVHTKTMEAGRRLCETMAESESLSLLQSECQTIEEAWQRTNSLLEGRTDLINTTVQKWTQFQDEINNIISELDDVKTRLKEPEASEGETYIQETELSLQRLASGLRELGTMKTDMSQYVAAGDSTLLEQQLEQLHSQWEELCMKVSVHRQEIADRLSAWTIFNDKNKEFCDWLTQMENKVCHSGDLSIEEMVEKLKKDCMEEVNLFSENKSHLKQLGEQLLLASDEAKQTQVHGSLQEVSQRWHNLFHHIEARVKKLKETLATVQQLDKNMSNLRSWLSRIEAELSRPITYSVCHHQEIQRRLAEQQDLQEDIEQHTKGVASVLSLCDVLLRDEDAAGSTEAESDSLQETSRSLDQRWRTICAMALDRRVRIEETWRLWCKFLDDYSRFEDWLKMAERTAASPNSADVLYTVAKEELKKFEGFQRQVHERLTQLELINNQYRRLARENRTDRASQLKAMVHEGNRRWDTLHRRVAAILRRLKYFTSQREEFEGTRDSMLVWLTELDLQLTNVEHFSESDVHHKMQQLNSFQKEITLNTERIDGLIVFGEGLIQKSSPQDAALIEDELEELHSYCQEVFSRLVRFHQRLSQPPVVKDEPELPGSVFSLESSLELICRPGIGRSQGSLPATPTCLLASPLERSGRETPVSVDSLPLEWDPSGDVGGSSSHEDDEEEEEHEGDRTYFSALSVPSRSKVVHDGPKWRLCQLDTEDHTEAASVLTSTPLKQGYLSLMSQCSGSIEDLKRVSLILDDEQQPQELGLTGLTASDSQSGVIQRWELLQFQPRSNQQPEPHHPQQLTSDLNDMTSWLENVIPELNGLQQSNPADSIEYLEAKAKELREMEKRFTHYKSIMLSVNLRAQVAPELREELATMNRDWSRACTGLHQWNASLRKTLMRCQEFHETLHSMLLWLAHAESRRYTVDIRHPDTPVRALQQHRNTLTDLQEELQGRKAQQASLQALWSQLQPEERAEESDEAKEKLHVTASKLKLLLKEVDQDLITLQQRLDCESIPDVESQRASGDSSQDAAKSNKDSSTQRARRDSSPPRSFFYRVLRAAFPLHLLLLLLLLLPCLIPVPESDSSCTVANNFARSFYPMLHYTNGPPPT
ncbi:nesprin-2 isoform X4 [Channa argus]|uniref:nesprin-2 isoform X4 n=1 Tax=Channa argus TaxID=215402 RepID=UPI003520BC4C